MYHIYIFSREEGSLLCLRLTQGVTPMSTTRLYRGYVNWSQQTHISTIGSTGKLRFHLVGRLEKGVNS
jgi:hypothetical protein